jgi:hypothetical protein
MKYRANGPTVSDKEIERLWARIDTDNEGCDCWPWLAVCDICGNPRFCSDSMQYDARKLLYSMLVADVPRGHVVVNTCKRRVCMNPEHLTVEPFVRARGWYGLEQTPLMNRLNDL